MARTDTLTNFLTDVADAIRSKTGGTSPITASSFDTEIGNISGGGGRDWTTIGYTSEPQVIADGFNYAQEVKTKLQNGTMTISQLSGNLDLRFAPSFSLSEITNINNLFKDSKNLISIAPLDFSGATYATYMFYECSSLKYLPAINTSNATSLNYTFYDCQSLKSIASLDTTKAKTLKYLFYNCANMETSPQMNTAQATDMGYLYQKCSSLTTASNLDCTNCTTLEYAFRECTSLTSLPTLSNTEWVASYNNFCYGCTSLTTFPSIDMSGATSINSFVQNCTNLTTFPVINIPYVRTMSRCFEGCPNFTDTSIDNIMQSLITATSYTSTKTLSFIGFTSANYPASRIQALPHYQDFINAGWSIGY